MTLINVEEEVIEKRNDGKRRKPNAQRATPHFDERFPVMGGVGVVQARTMEDSSRIVNDPNTLRQSLKKNGYVLLRGFLEKELVDAARAAAASKARHASRSATRSSSAASRSASFARV